MTKTADQIKPNYAPVYAAALYPKLAAIFQKHGYALAVHGSLARDFDLIAVPWIEKPSKRTVVIREMTTTFAIRLLSRPTRREHGRLAYWFSVGFGECNLDLSFFPDIERRKPKETL